jgi:hypothetical protein
MVWSRARSRDRVRSSSRYCLHLLSVSRVRALKHTSRSCSTHSMLLRCTLLSRRYCGLVLATHDSDQVRNIQCSSVVRCYPDGLLIATRDPDHVRKIQCSLVNPLPFLLKSLLVPTPVPTPAPDSHKKAVCESQCLSIRIRSSRLSNLEVDADRVH